MRFKLMALAATTIVAVPATGQTADVGAPVPVVKEKPKKEKKICKPAEANSYSRMAPVICRTKAEWDQNPNVSDNTAGVRSMSGDSMSSH